MGYIADLDHPALTTMPRRSQSRPQHCASPSINPSIHQSTPIIPSAIAIAVWEEASQFLNAKLPRSWMLELTRRAETICRHNPAFRARIHRSGNSGRDYLWSFMRHWLSGLIFKHDPVLAARLPATYKIGQALSGPRAA